MENLKHQKHLGLIACVSVLLLQSLPLSLQKNTPETNWTSQVFTFAQDDSFLKIEPRNLWPLTRWKQVNFKFRTDRPHGLLMYHTLDEAPVGAHLYELYVLLEGGQLKIIHEFGAKEEISYIGKGLNHDRWHEVKLKIDPIKGELNVSVDDIIDQIIPLQSVSKHSRYGYTDNNSPSTLLFFGGTDTKKPIGHQQQITKRFIGCLGNIEFSHSPHDRVRAVQFADQSGLTNGCINKCDQLDLCLHNGPCVNHYTNSSCDCFGTKYEDDFCRNNNLATLTMHGYSFVSYRVYDWQDRVHSELNRISLEFKTKFPSAILLYANGEHPNHNYIALSLNKGKLYFEINFGDGAFNATVGENTLANDKWHNITILHHARHVTVFLDTKIVSSLKLHGEHHHLHIDPELYIGGVHNVSLLHKKISGISGIPVPLNHKFVGCMRSIYFNDKNVLYDLREGIKSARYHSVFPPQFGCSPVDDIPITFSTKNSYLNLHSTPKVNSSYLLKLSLEFKTEQKNVALASGSIRNKEDNKSGRWLLHLKEGTPAFSIIYNGNLIKSWSLRKPIEYLQNIWQQIGITFDTNGVVTMNINVDRFLHRDTYIHPTEFQRNILVGVGETVDDRRANADKKELAEGLLGCIRDLWINDKPIDPRDFINDRSVVNGKISLDNCQLVDPCNNANACEHGGKCKLLANGETECDCTNTGYTGRTCHFALYKRTCEELYLVGYRESGTYIIDIDHNGPLPPAHVECIMSEGKMIETVVHHNMEKEQDVRHTKKLGNLNFYANVTYREFSPPMIQSLIQHSKQCFQWVRYYCFAAPLGLGAYTWMESSYPSSYVVSLGSELAGRCSCSVGNHCVDPSKFCNCDSRQEDWNEDSAELTSPKDVGITGVYILQPNDMPQNAEARLKIGPVRCIDSNTQQYEITFKTKESYLKVPGWKSGDMAFSFRTSTSKAILFYQAALHSQHGYFKVILSNDYELTMEFTVNGAPRNIKLPSKRRLNTGEWQQVWIDHNEHHMRFTVNVDSIMIDLEGEQEFGAFEGPLYIGGAPKSLLKEDDIRLGFIGCFRGLVIDDTVVDLHKHLYRKGPNIEEGCQPSCLPNPCKNDATCVDYWGSYKCLCTNPVAHSGKNCDTNLNTNGMTFITQSSYFLHLAGGVDVNPILEKNILISFRTHQNESLIFYANDYNNNFVQLHIDKGSRIIFTFNTLSKIVSGAVELGDVVISGKPIQISINRNSTQTVLTATSSTSSGSVLIDAPIKFLTKYEQRPWKEDEHLEMVKPARPSFPIQPFSQLFFGGVDELGGMGKIPGFVGCLQGFVIDGKLFHLETVAEKLFIESKGQIRPGCNMLCDRQPCANGGACIEEWRNNATKCNCGETSYLGETCDREVGARFNGYSHVSFAFSPDTMEVLDQVYIHLAFSTDSPASSQRTLLFVDYDDDSRYILISLTPEGGILVEEDLVDKVLSTVIQRDKNTYADGWRHWIKYFRNGNDAKIIVDNVAHAPTITDQEPSTPPYTGERRNLVIVGATQRGDTRFEDHTNYMGCISNVIVKLDSLVMEPLVSAFGGKDLDKVQVDGDIMQGKCAEFHAIKRAIAAASNEPLPAYSQNNWVPQPPKFIPYDVNFQKPKGRLSPFGSAGDVFLAFGVTFVVLVIIAVSIYMWRLQRTYKIKQLKEDTPFFNSKRNSSIKEVKFSMMTGGNYDDNEAAARLLQHEQDNNLNSLESHPLQEPRRLSDVRESAEFNRGSVDEHDNLSPNHRNFNSGKPKEFPVDRQTNRDSSYQELEWDPAADNADLITTAMKEMNPADADIALEKELRRRSKAPLASVSEVSINLLPLNSVSSTLEIVQDEPTS